MTDTNSTAAAPPLLTVAIPTWNRATYLAQSLAQLHSELRSVAAGQVEIIVSDNCSPDATPQVVKEAVERGLPIRYVRNEKNLGWALNFAQAFDLARGKYVLLMGDDDPVVDGSLTLLISRLEAADYGVVILKPYGFDEDFRREHPGGRGSERVFTDPDRFLIATNRYFTLTSACVVNKSMLAGVDSREYCNTDLAAFHFVLKAALAAPRSLFLDHYLVASKRQNSFSYEYVNVFVDQMWRIIDAHVAYGLKSATIRTLERRKLLCYYPFYLFDLQRSRRGDLALTYQKFAARFGDRWLFKVWLAPIIRLPRPLALVWGAATTFIGRILDGQLRRGLKFAWNQVTRGFARRPATAQQTQSTTEPALTKLHTREESFRK